MNLLISRRGDPFNLAALQVGGLDIGALLSQISANNGTNMASNSSTVTVTTRYRANVAGVGYAAGFRMVTMPCAARPLVSVTAPAPNE